ncbi:MAG: response regulator, partial [Anaerolineae bacterium]|nr:response regulator [Anaerolineae bacterium]
RDITRELQLEEQYLQAQKMQAVGQLTAGIAHDFNNLLTAINGFAELAQSRREPNQAYQDMLDKILRSGRRAADLVKQLMAFSRKQVLESQVVNLNAVVTDIEKMLQRIIGEHITLKTAPAPDLGLVKVDPAQFQQVIVNLAVNARDAMPDGGCLTIETANVTLDENYTAEHLEMQPGEYVLLTVSDNGFGMSAAVKARIFEPFFTTKEPGQGTGLGLATVFGIVKQSGGYIWVYSEEGLGATFKIYLPRIHQAAGHVSFSESTQDLPVGTETVLVVEDDAGVREFITRSLNQQGYAMLEAADGREAMRLVQNHRGAIHLLLTDVIMPGANGKTLAAELGQICPGLKILFMSGYTNAALAQHGVLEPGIAFLPKPFTTLGLARKVREVLDVA